MTITKNQITGAYEISAIIGTRYLHRTYMGYTRREAVALFREYMREEAN